MPDFYYCVSKDDHVRIYKNAVYLTKFMINAIRILDASICRLDDESKQRWYILDVCNVLHQVVFDINSEDVNTEIVELPTGETIRDISIMLDDGGDSHVVIMDTSACLYQIHGSEIVNVLDLFDSDPSCRFLPHDGCGLIVVDNTWIHAIWEEPRRNLDDLVLRDHRHPVSGTKSIIDMNLWKVAIVDTDAGPLRIDFRNGTSSRAEMRTLPSIDRELLNQYVCSLDTQGGIYFNYASGSTMIEELKIPDDCKPVEIVKIGCGVGYGLRARHTFAVIQDSLNRLYLLAHDRSGLKMSLIEDGVQLKTQLPAYTPGRRTKSARH